MNDFWAGIKSKYPLCCIIFFCDFWCEVKTKHLMFHGRPECYDYNTHVGYVQCPECVVRYLL